MNKVYIIQDMPRHDYSGAEMFGQLVFIGTEDINSRFGVLATPSNRKVLYNVAKVLKDFQEGDVLLLDGNPLLFAAALSWIVDKGFDIPVLKWDNRSRDYVVTLYPHNLVQEMSWMVQTPKEFGLE